MVEKLGYPTIAEVAGISHTETDVSVTFRTGVFSVPRDMFNLSLGFLRAILPENYGQVISNEVSNALDDEGRLDPTKLSPQLASLAVALSEFARYIGNSEAASLDKSKTRRRINIPIPPLV